MKMTSLVYLEREGKYLMLHRTKKKDDENRDKWIGVGGKFEEGESPEDCMRREVLEETGLAVTAFRYRGIVTFVLGERQTEYMHLFTATAWSGEEKECDEGELAWIDRDALFDLTLWEGDRIFLRLLREEHPFFSLKLVYSDSGDLLGAALNGEALAIGNPS